MSLRDNLNGYYTDEGRWQKTKYCFMSCGSRCDCGPPGGLYYSAAHDKRLKCEEQEMGGQSCPAGNCCRNATCKRES